MRSDLFLIALLCWSSAAIAQTTPGPAVRINGRIGNTFTIDPAFVGSPTLTLNGSDYNAAAFRNNIGLAPVAESGSASDLTNGTIPAARLGGVAPLLTNNGSDYSATAFRANIGLGGAATLNVGTSAGTVMAGNDPRIASGAAVGVANIWTAIQAFNAGATAATPVLSDNSLLLATTAFVKGQGYISSGSFAPIATSGSASDLATGTLPAARLGGVAPLITNNGSDYNATAFRANIGVGAIGQLNTIDGVPICATTACIGNFSTLTIGGASTAPSATTDTTNAANIASGSLPYGRLAGTSADFISPEQFKGGSDPDDTLSINAALAVTPARNVRLLDGKTYNICAPLVIHSNQQLYGGTGTVVHACSNWTAANPVSIPTTEQNGQFIVNANWHATSITDSNIHVHDFQINGTAISVTGNLHAIGFRMASSVEVDHIFCLNVGDCTAFQATFASKAHDNVCTGSTDVCFDHWEGPHYAEVYDNHATCGPMGAAIMFTGASTSMTDGAGAHLHSHHNNIVCSNSVQGTGAQIEANTLTAGSSLVDVTSDNDFVDLGSSTVQLGIRYIGFIAGGAIRNARVDNVNGPQAIVLSADSFGLSPQNIDIIDPDVENATTASGNFAPIAMQGTNHRLINPKVRARSGTSSYATAAYANSPTTTIVGGNMDPGLNGFIRRDNGAVLTPAQTDTPISVPSATLATPLAWASGGTADAGTAWTTYTPSLSAGSGSFGSASAIGRYKKIGTTVFLRVQVTITSNGTAATSVVATLPFPAAVFNIGAGRANGVSGKMLQAVASGGLSTLTFFNYDSTYPGQNGEVLMGTIIYEANS